jgi:hypothetical protein
VRTFEWDKRAGRLRVRDSYELGLYESFESSIIVERPVFLRDGMVTIPAGDFTLVARPSAYTAIATAEEHEYRDHSGASRKVNRIILKPVSIRDQREISYELAVVPLPPPIPITREHSSAEPSPDTAEIPQSPAPQ